MRAIAGALLGVLAAAGTAAAGTLGVAPIRVEVGAKTPIAVLTVRNQEDTPVVVQARPAAWSQHDSQDQLDDTHDLLVTPPLFTIPPGSEQVVRVALLRKPDVARELDYRLVLSEVPPAAAPETNGLRVALRITLPVFVAAPVHTAPDVSWHHSWASDGTLRITAENHGTAHIQVNGFDVTDAGRADQKLHADNGHYLLPGASAHWELHEAPGAPHPQNAHILIQGHSDAGDFSVTSEPGGP